MKVLVAEDDPTSSLMLQEMLSEWGFQPIIAEDGLKAWEILQEKDAPSIAILDWEMPGMDGTEISRRLRAESKERLIHIIILTSRTLRRDVVAGLLSGADDYLTKPFDQEELKARITVGRRILTLQEALANRLKEIEDTMTSIQESFLIGQIPRQIRGADIAATLIPYSMISGDFYDFFPHSTRCFDLVTGDVMGKGIKPALLAAATNYQILRHLRELLVNVPEEAPPSMVRVLDEALKHLVNKFQARESFVTLFFGRFDLDRRLLSFANFGHQPPVFFSRRQAQSKFLESTNSAIGFQTDQHPQILQIPFEPGDIFLFTSDGISEARDQKGRFFGKTGVRKTLEAHTDATSASLVAAVCQAAQTFAIDHSFNDDATCLAVRINSD